MRNTARASRDWLALALGLALASITAAWVFELGLGYLPCKLCLWQRWPYYVGIPLGLAAFALRGNPALARPLTLLFVLTFFVSAGLGAYHAGVEWRLWQGPTDCGGRLFDAPASVDDLRRSMQTAKVIRCDEAALRVLGLSFAGWNVVLSLAVAALGLLALGKAQGSSSVSQ